MATEAKMRQSRGDIASVVSEIETAVAAVSDSIAKLHLKVAEVEAEIKTVLDATVSVEFEFKPITIGGSVEFETADTVCLTFAPRPLRDDDTLSKEMQKAVEAIGRGIEALAASYEMKEASIEIAFGITLDGTIKIIVGGELSRERCHTARLKLGPA